MAFRQSLPSDKNTTSVGSIATIQRHADLQDAFRLGTRYSDSMHMEICQNDADFVGHSNRWVEDKVKQHSAHSLFLPAGNTPLPLYQAWEMQRPAFLQTLTLMQVDDVATGEKRHLFRRFFEARLPSYVRQMTFIDEAEATADLAILGLGLNGHIAFHEPGVPRSFFSGCLPLAHETKQNLGLANDDWGVSYGLAAFLRCQAILLIVRGDSKRDILTKALNQDAHLPAAQLLQHPEVTVLADKAAAP